MGADLTGPNFNQSEEETVGVLAKRAKHNLFGADESDTKSIVTDILKTDEQETDQKDAQGAMNKAERQAKNNATTGESSFEEDGVSMKDMKKKLNTETEEIEEDMKKDLESSCEPEAPL